MQVCALLLLSPKKTKKTGKRGPPEAKDLALTAFDGGAVPGKLSKQLLITDCVPSALTGQESPRSTARGEVLRFWSRCSDKLIILSSIIDYRLRDLTRNTRLTSVTTHSTTLTFVLLSITTLSALIASE